MVPELGEGAKRVLRFLRDRNQCHQPDLLSGDTNRRGATLRACSSMPWRRRRRRIAAEFSGWSGRSSPAGAQAMLQSPPLARSWVQPEPARDRVPGKGRGGGIWKKSRRSAGFRKKAVLKWRAWLMVGGGGRGGAFTKNKRQK